MLASSEFCEARHTVYYSAYGISDTALKATPLVATPDDFQHGAHNARLSPRTNFVIVAADAPEETSNGSGKWTYTLWARLQVPHYNRFMDADASCVYMNSPSGGILCINRTDPAPTTAQLVWSPTADISAHGSLSMAPEVMWFISYDSTTQYWNLVCIDRATSNVIGKIWMCNLDGPCSIIVSGYAPGDGGTFIATVPVPNGRWDWNRLVFAACTPKSGSIDKCRQLKLDGIDEPIYYADDVAYNPRDGTVLLSYQVPFNESTKVDRQWRMTLGKFDAENAVFHAIEGATWTWNYDKGSSNGWQSDGTGWDDITGRAVYATTALYTSKTDNVWQYLEESPGVKSSTVVNHYD